MAMVVVVAVLFVVALVLLQSVKSHLVQQVDRSLVNESAYADRTPAAITFPRATTPAGQLGQFFLANGTLLGSSTNLKGMPALIKVSPAGPLPRLSTIYNRRFGNLRVLELRLGGRSGFDTGGIPGDQPDRRSRELLDGAPGDCASYPCVGPWGADLACRRQSHETSGGRSAGGCRHFGQGSR